MPDRWQNAAACAGDTNKEWIEDVLTLDTATTCFVCTVRLECLTEALPRHRDWDVGIWGGTTPIQRGDIRKGKASVVNAWRSLEKMVKEAHDGRFVDMVGTGGLLSRKTGRRSAGRVDRRTNG